ncbi:hypothetical protein WH96_15075 [Kiloniella spongiae]|uniref:Uncharacterized protein n=1 Tax=Kiloniella spongiae TaxID=1489064 RepID=A0A0H2MCV9_9PROT|nr:hypothetical protein [Kiloniella spongiae]KLN60021.1 hypothetical protein WH96_15075 [Kiloniella spongiae]
MRALGRIAGTMVAIVAGFSSLAGKVHAQDLAGEPAPNQLIAFDGLEYAGAAKVFELAPDQLYSFVPSLGDLSDRVSSLKLGSQVGAIFFEGPLFQTTDKSCAPLLGSKEEPHLLWQGPSADLVPLKRVNDVPISMAAPQDDTYSSMIIYRRDMGPPPGVLMLQRLNTYSRGCANVLEQLNYRRAFIPAWDKGRTGYCQNLVGPTTYAGERGTFRFNDSDQLVFMHPVEMDPAYQSVRHRVRATLYDFPDCQGNHVTFPFKAESIRKFNLADYGYKGRARSVKVEYVSGPASAVSGLAVASAAPKTVVTKTGDVTAPAKTVTPQVTAVEPKTVSQAPQTFVAPEPAVTQETPTTKKSVETPQSTAVQKPIPQASAEAQTFVAPEPQTFVAPESQVFTAPAPAYSPADSDLLAAGITPAGDDALIPQPTQVTEGELERQAITSQSENPLFTPSYQLFEAQPAENVDSQPLSSGSSDENGSLPTETAERFVSPSTGGTTYEFPVFDAYRLNYCLTPGTNCGEPAAREWCQKKGHETAVAWVRDDNIGSIFPTINMGSKEICSNYRCDGFKELTCSN